MHGRARPRLILKINLDLSIMITLLTCAAVLGGFYYTTSDRLDGLEVKVELLQKKINKIRRNR